MRYGVQLFHRAQRQLKLFSGCRTLDIHARDSDIERFVEGQLQEDNFLRKKVATDVQLKKLVVDTIVTKANGM